MQAAGGRIDITKVRLHQGDILAIGGGALSLNSDGRLEGELRITMAGLEQFLTAIGAQQRVQASPSVDRLAGALDRLAPGLGDVARQQAGANISLGINMLGEQTTLEGKRAVTFYVDPTAAKQLSRLSVDEDTSVQALMVEALNDLFAKRGLHRIA